MLSKFFKPKTVTSSAVSELEIHKVDESLYEKKSEADYFGTDFFNQETKKEVEYLKNNSKVVSDSFVNKVSTDLLGEYLAGRIDLPPEEVAKLILGSQKQKGNQITN